MRTLNRVVAGLTVLTVSLSSASTPAHAATTTDARVVSSFMYEDAAGNTINADSGWAATGVDTGKVEIGSAYGAPEGLGHEAVMLDTPAAGDTATLYALTNQPSYAGAFPDAVTVTPDRRLGFWLYRSGPAGNVSTPVLEGWVAKGNQHLIITFDPTANGYTAVKQWLYVDATATTARWTVRSVGDDPSVRESMPWSGVVQRTSIEAEDGTISWGVFDYGLSFQQAAPGSNAIDGVTVSTVAGSSLTNFELRPTSGRPLLDDCKNDGWRSHPAGPFKNQGACIAAIVAAH